MGNPMTHEQGNAALSPAPQPSECPKCGSPDPKKHPAAQFEGEVQICDHAFHSPPADAAGMLAEVNAIFGDLLTDIQSMMPHDKIGNAIGPCGKARSRVLKLVSTASPTDAAVKALVEDKS